MCLESCSWCTGPVAYHKRAIYLPGHALAEGIREGHNGRFGGDLEVDFNSICRKTADLYGLEIDGRRDHPSVAVGCVELETSYIIVL
jgi:hypothetical protein